MNLNVTFRRSKLARQILVLFLICALLPLLSLSFFSYFQVTQNLTEQGFRELRQNTKTVSLSIYERLMLLETEMRFIAEHLIDKGSGQIIKGVKKFPQPNISHYKALGVLNFQGIQHLIAGNFDHLPSIKSIRTPSYDYRKAIIVVQNFTYWQAAVFLMIGLEDMEFGNDFLVAEINPDFLWGIGEADSLPPGTEICVLNSAGKPIVTTIPQPRGLLASLDPLQSSSVWGQFKWKHQGRQYLANSRELFLQSRFQFPGWMVVLSRSKSDALASVTEFKIIFLLVLALSILIVLLFSTNYIRKSLTPLEKLKEGTQQIADGNFRSRVAIDSDDEFEELAAAFNKMSEKLNHQFNELSMLAKIGKTTASIMSKDKLIQVASRIIEKYLDFDRMMILMVNGNNNTLYYAGGYGYRDDIVRRIKNYELEPFTESPNNPISSAFTEQKPISLVNSVGSVKEQTGNLNPFLTAIDSRCITCVPIVYEQESLGVMVLERANCKEGKRENDEKLLIGVASQLAVSIANLTSYSKLTESEARFRKSFDYAASGIVLLNLDGYFMDINEYFLNMLGYPEHELFGHTIYEICHPEDTQAVSISLERLKTGEIEFDSFEQRFLNKEGQTCWVLASTSLLQDSEGQPLHYILLFQDLTDKKLTEVENIKLEARLQQAQKMEAIGTLAGGIAHDFNNILSGIMGYAQLGLLEADPDSDNHRWFQGVQEACDRATELVRQILTFSRQGEQERTPIQIRLIIKEALKLLKATLPLNIDIHEKISSEPGVVLADSTQIHQLVMNLCTNAYHSMIEQGGTLEVILASEELSPGVRSQQLDLPPGSYLKLTVSDTGCGMDSKTLNKIFDPYYTTKEADKGTGLGLSVVHGIVESHGGAIAVHSEPGQGTRFEVLFPRSETDRKKGDEKTESIPTGTEKILLVDDEDAVVETGRSILTKLGYRVEAFTDPQNAFDEFRTHGNEFDLVITDMSMPHMTGEELSKKLMKIRPDIPILLCTGYSDQFNAANAHALGIKKFLIKPLEMGQLANIIREVLDKDSRSLPN